MIQDILNSFAASGPGQVVLSSLQQQGWTPQQTQQILAAAMPAAGQALQQATAGQDPGQALHAFFGAPGAPAVDLLSAHISNGVAQQTGMPPQYASNVAGLVASQLSIHAGDRLRQAFGPYGQQGGQAFVPGGFGAQPGYGQQAQYGGAKKDYAPTYSPQKGDGFDAPQQEYTKKGYVPPKGDEWSGGYGQPVQKEYVGGKDDGYTGKYGVTEGGAGDKSNADGYAGETYDGDGDKYSK